MNALLEKPAVPMSEVSIESVLLDADLFVKYRSPDKAFALLDKAADKYDQFVLFAKIDPAMEPLRGDSRYAAYLTRLGLQ